jgi:gibberellin 20-oxidase
MAATLNFDANSTLRNAGLMSPVPHSESKQLPAMFIEADKTQRSSEDSWEASEHAELEVPVLDLEVLNSGPDKLGQRQELVKAMAKACQKWGFFQVLNHGVDQALIDRCEVEAHRMFALPLEVKERVHRRQHLGEPEGPALGGELPHAAASNLQHTRDGCKALRRG